MRRAGTVSALLVGTLFGLGLAVSQMTDPMKVLSFLSLVPGWDPSLLLVMAAAVTVSFVGYRWALGRQPLFESGHSLPGTRRVDARLVGGAAIFGIGWGLAGFCPGPAIAGLAGGSVEPWLFLAAMVAGAQAERFLVQE